MSTKAANEKFSQRDIDMMLWQYCMGVLELANAVHPSNPYAFPPAQWQIDLLNKLSAARYEHLSKHFNVSASFTISFSVDGNHIRLTKQSV